jgi:hypothetical protein
MRLKLGKVETNPVPVKATFIQGFSRLHPHAAFLLHETYVKPGLRDSIWSIPVRSGVTPNIKSDLPLLVTHIKCYHDLGQENGSSTP